MSDPVAKLSALLRPVFADLAGGEADPTVRPSDRADAQINGALPLAKRLGSNPRELAQQIVDSGAAIVWTTLTGGETLDIFGNAVSQGFEGFWSGNSPSFNYIVNLGSDFAADFDKWWFHSYA